MYNAHSSERSRIQRRSRIGHVGQNDARGGMDKMVGSGGNVITS